MRLLFTCLSVPALPLFAGCLKSEKPCTPISTEKEEEAILSYISNAGINALRHSSGLYYLVTDEGTGETPSVSDVINVKYTGKLTDNTVFDSSNELIYPLSYLIPGWQLGIPLIKEGGAVTLIIPPSLAYGCEANQGIPGNSVLVFDIELNEIVE